MRFMRSSLINMPVSMPRPAHIITMPCRKSHRFSISSAGLDYDKMNEAAQLLLTTHDFTSFAKLHTDAKTNICKVTHACWHQIPGTDGWVFVITADRFLRNMVRAVVGTLVEVVAKCRLKSFRLSSTAVTVAQRAPQCPVMPYISGK